MAKLGKLSSLLLVLFFLSNLGFAAEAVVVIKADDFTDEVSASLVIAPDGELASVRKGVALQCTADRNIFAIITQFMTNDFKDKVNVKMRFDKNPSYSNEMLFVGSTTAATGDVGLITKFEDAVKSSDSFVVKVGDSPVLRFSLDTDDKEKIKEYLVFSAENCKY